MNDDEGHVRWWEKEDCFAGRGNGRSPHYQNSRTASLIYWRREGAAVGFLLLYCQQLSICNTEGLLSLLRGNKSPPPPLLYLSQPLAPGFILEMLFEGLWFSCFSSGRFSLWEGFLFFVFFCRGDCPFLSLEFAVFVLKTFLVMFWSDWKCDFPDSQRQGVTWPTFPHRSPCGECVCVLKAKWWRKEHLTGTQSGSENLLGRG